MAKSKKSASRRSSKPAAAPPPPPPAAPKGKLQMRVKDTQAKYDRKIKSAKRELKHISQELAQVRQPIYSLNRKIKEAPSKYYAAKYRREKREFEAFIQPHVDDLKAQRADFKQLAKDYSQLRHDRDKARRTVTSLQKKIEKAEENQDWQTVEKLTYELIKQQGIADNSAELLGAKIQKEEIEGYEPEKEEDKAGYTEDPANPLTIWQAIHQFEEDRESGNWDWFIINGKRISAENEILLAMEASTFWSSLKLSGTKTPYVLRYYNFEKRTVKYKPYHS